MPPLSREFLLSRGRCCGNGCVNCPYSEDLMKPSVSLVSRHRLSDESLKKIANQLAIICGSPSWTVSVHDDSWMTVYTFTSTRKNVPMNRYGKCQAYVEGVQFGINVVVAAATPKKLVNSWFFAP